MTERIKLDSQTLKNIVEGEDLDFCKRFFEMAGIGLGVAAFIFLVGHVIRIFLGIDV